jgi:hypothetical protein
MLKKVSGVGCQDYENDEAIFQAFIFLLTPETFFYGLPRKILRQFLYR